MHAAADNEQQVFATASTPASRVAQVILHRLVVQRQELRRSGSTRATLEANRLAIVFWQQRLTKAVAAEHRPARVRGIAPFGP